MITPLRAAIPAPREYSSRARSRSRAAVSAPTRATTSPYPMNSSCAPAGALVVGVNAGSGSFEPSSSPGGSGTPEIEPLARYSCRPSPARYPRAMHSIWIISSRRQRMARPAHSGGTSAAEITWLGTTSASRANHHSESWVRILPLSRIGVGRTTSYTDTRSDATSTTSLPAVGTTVACRHGGPRSGTGVDDLAQSGWAPDGANHPLTAEVHGPVRPGIGRPRLGRTGTAIRAGSGYVRMLTTICPPRRRAWPPRWTLRRGARGPAPLGSPSCPMVARLSHGGPVPREGRDQAAMGDLPARGRGGILRGGQRVRPSTPLSVGKPASTQSWIPSRYLRTFV